MMTSAGQPGVFHATSNIQAQPSVLLSVDLIVTDGGTQPRAWVDVTVIEDYTTQIAAGAVFPPIVVFHDGARYWLADRFHRFHARRDGLGEAEIEAEIRQGTQRDAILYSVGANAAHGMRRTNQDKRRAVMRLLEDAKWRAWSDREIASRCAVSFTLVAELRKSVTASSCSEERTYTTKHGTVATMRTGAIGRATEAEPGEEPEPLSIFASPGQHDPALACAHTLRQIQFQHASLPHPNVAALAAPDFALASPQSIAGWWREFAARLATVQSGAPPARTRGRRAILAARTGSKAPAGH